MKNKIVCSLLLCFLRACAMDMAPEESLLQKIYGYDRGVINNFELKKLTPGSKKEAAPVTVLRNISTNTVHITRRDNGNMLYICKPSLLDDIAQKFEECGNLQNMLHVSLWDGNTHVLLRMDIGDIRNANKRVDESLLSKSYYIRSCALYDSKKKYKDNLLQGQIEYCDQNISGESATFNHLFSIDIDGNSEGPLWGALLSPMRKKMIMNYLKKQKPFILELASLDKGEVTNLLVNTFDQAPTEPTPPGSIFFRYPAIVIVPFCGIVVYLLHLYFKKS